MKGNFDMGVFLLCWVVFGLLFQVVSLPLAPFIGFHRQMSLAGGAGALFAGYIVYLT